MSLTAADYWDLIHVERGRLAALLDGLSDDQWRAKSLCTQWTVEQVVAHLSAAANTGTLAWLRSIIFAGFNADRHNARRLAEHVGSTPQGTLEEYRRSAPLRVAPTKDFGAWLGEVVVHGQDIAHPLGIALVPATAAVTEVASYYAAKDFAVNSHTVVKGLSLVATDADFAVGAGPRVEGPILNLVMAMAGRRDFVADLSGDGVTTLAERIT